MPQDNNNSQHVTCPVCNKKVMSHHINQHIDSQCIQIMGSNDDIEKNKNIRPKSIRSNESSILVKPKNRSTDNMNVQQMFDIEANQIPHGGSKSPYRHSVENISKIAYEKHASPKPVSPLGLYSISDINEVSTAPIKPGKIIESRQMTPGEVLGHSQDSLEKLDPTPIIYGNKIDASTQTREILPFDISCNALPSRKVDILENLLPDDTTEEELFKTLERSAKGKNVGIKVTDRTNFLSESLNMMDSKQSKIKPVLQKYIFY
jgi:hypothetical protein